MADVTKVQASDGTIYTLNDEDDYTKDEIDAMLADKADVGVSYTKTEEDALLADKADKDVTYTKAEVDDLLLDKTDAGTSYTKAEDNALLDTKADKTDVEDALLLKADKADTYTKSETDGLLADKADVGDSYTKAEDDALLADKANSTDVYTKAEVDALIGGIKMLPLLDFTNPVFTFDENNTSFTAQGECYLYGTLYGSANLPEITINGTKIIHAGAHTSTVGANMLVEPIRLISGDTVSITALSIYCVMHIFNERSV